MNPQSFVNSYKGDANGLQEGLGVIVESRMESFRKKRDALAATAQRISGPSVNQSIPSAPSVSPTSNIVPVEPEVVDLTVSDCESSEYYVVRRKSSRHKSRGRHSGEEEKGKGSHGHKRDKSASNNSKRHKSFSHYRQC